MLFKKVLIAKVIILIALMVSITMAENSEQSYVSKNWHKTQVFIFYNSEHSNEQNVDCLGTVLSPRFILTTATCIALSVGTSPNLQHAVITKICGVGNHIGPTAVNTIDKYKIEKFTIHPDFSPEKQFPDLAILKLTQDMAEIYLSSTVEKFYPQESPGADLLKEVRTLTLNDAGFLVS